MAHGEIDLSELEVDHFRNWDRSLHRAIQNATQNDLKVGETAWFTAELRIRLTRQNPGWADGYIVVLTKDDS